MFRFTWKAKRIGFRLAYPWNLKCQRHILPETWLPEELICRELSLGIAPFPTDACGVLGQPETASTTTTNNAALNNFKWLPRLNGHTRHSLALGSATLTCLGAFTAVIVVVLAAFLGASVTHLRADPAYFCREFRAAAHYKRGRMANDRAIAIERDAARQHLYIVFPQTHAGAMFTFIRAVITRFNTINEFLVRHIVFLLDRRSSPSRHLTNEDNTRFAKCFEVSNAEKTRR